MTYEIFYTDPLKSNTPISVVDQQLNSRDTSLTLVGKNYPGYGPIIESDLIHLLEHFANSLPPVNPIEGQLWYNTADSLNKVLMINAGDLNGSRWVPAGGVWRQSYQPTSPTIGDLWADTANQQVKLFNGSVWVIVGPNTSGSITGFVSTATVDSQNNIRDLILGYVGGQVVTVLSNEFFIPAVSIAGFPSIYPGINISTATLSTASYQTILNGTAVSSQNLIQTVPVTQTVPANSFVRNDINQTLHGTITIAADDSLVLGSSGNMITKTVSGKAILANTNQGSQIGIQITTSTALSPTDLITLDGYTNRVGVNTVSPTSTLDVFGNMRVTSTATFLSDLGVAGNFTITSATVSGDISVGGTSSFAGTITVYNTAGSGVVIEPELYNQYDLGSPSLIWRNIYAATLIGNVSGAANRLTGNSTYQIAGDINSTPVVTNGSAGTYTFTSTVASSVIGSRSETITTSDSDEFLILQSGSLFKQAKSTLMSNVYPSLSPTGSITIYGTSTPPAGWLTCNGAFYSTIAYPALYGVIGNTYGSGSGTFAVPNLAGVTTIGTPTVTTIYMIKV